MSRHAARVFVEVSAERAVAELAFRPDLAQLTGLFHGGVILSLADETATACSMANVMPDGTWDPAKFPLTIQLSANLIRNTNTGKLIAEAVPLHRGRTSMVMQTTVRDEQGRVMARGHGDATRARSLVNTPQQDVGGC